MQRASLGWDPGPGEIPGVSGPSPAAWSTGRWGCGAEGMQVRFFLQSIRVPAEEAGSVDRAEGVGPEGKAPRADGSPGFSSQFATIC